jgi:hypothetical protein
MEWNPAYSTAGLDTGSSGAGQSVIGRACREPFTTTELFASLENAAGPARRFGVRHNGLALLAAYCFEVIRD